MELYFTFIPICEMLISQYRTSLTKHSTEMHLVHSIKMQWDGSCLIEQAAIRLTASGILCIHHQFECKFWFISSIPFSSNSPLFLPPIFKIILVHYSYLYCYCDVVINGMSDGLARKQTSMLSKLLHSVCYPFILWLPSIIAKTKYHTL